MCHERVDMSLGAMCQAYLGVSFATIQSGEVYPLCFATCIAQSDEYMKGDREVE